MIEFSTKYHEKVENTEFYKALRAIMQDTLDQHLCAADDEACFDEKIDGVYVSGKEEAAMFIAQFIHKEIKEAWEDGWRVRDKSCGINRQSVMLKKYKDYLSFKSTLINELNQSLKQ
jgi:hypothetical protein